MDKLISNRTTSILLTLKNYQMKQSTYLLLFVLISGFFFTHETLKAQKVKIEVTNLEILNNKLNIDYKFIKSKSNQRYNVWVEITKSTGEKINAKALSGDVGDNITGGENKQIIWDYNKNGIILDDEINVEVFADITVLGPGPGKAIFLSAILPGLGLTAMDKGKPYWIMGVAGYGLLAGSVYMNKTAEQEYKDYLDAKDTGEANDFYDSSKKYNQLSQTMAYAAIGVWAGSLIWTTLKAIGGNKSTMGSINKKQKLFLYGGINPYTKTSGFTLKYRF